MFIGRILLLILAMCVLDGGQGFAKDPDHDSELDALMRLDIEDLVVSVASRREEKVKNAPGIMSVITSNDIASYGANNLHDLLLRLPNVYTFGTAGSRENAISIRGQQLSTFDSHVLILLNGRPFRENVAGGLNSAIYESIPLEAIERIEVIRGPGSVLYGTYAFAGVLNIILKKNSGENQNSIRAGYGSNNTVQTSGVVGQQIGDWNVTVGGKLFDSDGWGFHLTDEAQVSSSTAFREKNYGVTAVAENQGFRLTGFSGHADDTTLGNPVTWPAKDSYSLQRDMLDLQYQHSLTSDWKTVANFTYNHMDLVNAFKTNFTSNNMIFEGALQGQLFSKLNVLIGGAYRRLEDDPGIGTNSWSDEHSVYFQADYQALDWLNFIGGVQVNRTEGNSHDPSPRLGAIAQLTDTLGVKLLYGKAYRSPTAGERDVNTFNFKGNRSLQPETINTFDAQVFYHLPRFQTALTYYNSKQDDTIKATIQGSTVMYVNQGKIDYEGVEWEFQWKALEQIDFIGSMSYQVNEDDTGQRDVGHIPNFMAKMGATYRITPGLSLGLFDSYFGNAQSINSARQVNPPADAYHWMTLQSTWKIPKTLLPHAIPGMELNLFVDNLLDVDAYYPEVARGVINTLPIRRGIGAFGNVVIRF